VTSLEDKIKKLQKHQAFQAELAANGSRVSELRDLATKLVQRQGSANSKPIKESMEFLQKEWNELLHKAEQTGRGLEEAQDILEFNNQVDKIESWIRAKEMMVFSRLNYFILR
jgi:spectrin beta